MNLGTGLLGTNLPLPRLHSLIWAETEICVQPLEPRRATKGVTPIKCPYIPTHLDHPKADAWNSTVILKFVRGTYSGYDCTVMTISYEVQPPTVA